MALRQRNLPSDWFREAERYPENVLTALHLVEQQDEELRKEADKT